MTSTQLSTKELVRLRWRAQTFQLPSRRPVKSVIAGVHLSRFRGRGVDYLESRNYEIGDDIRNLDWRVTARTGKPHTKIFHEERERPVIVVVDFDPRMFFATRGRLKAIVAAELAALSAWTATRRGDRIGGILFAGSDHHEMRPRGGRRGALRLIRFLDQTYRATRSRDFDQPAGIPAALGRLRRIARPGSLVLLLSDFMGLSDECERHLSRLSQHIDLLALQILDPIERDVPPPGRYPVSNGQDMAVLNLANAGVRKRYAENVVERSDAAARLLARHRVPVLRVSTTDDTATAFAGIAGTSRGRR